MHLWRWVVCGALQVVVKFEDLVVLLFATLDVLVESFEAFVVSLFTFWTAFGALAAGVFNEEVLWLCVTNMLLAEYVEVTQHDLVQYMPGDDAATEVAEAAARGCRRALAKCVALRAAGWRSTTTGTRSA